MKRLLIVVTAFMTVHAAVAIAESRALPIVRIGMSLPFTGDLKEYGAAVRNGVELARARMPNEFSRFEFLYEDNKYDAREAVTVFERLRAAPVDFIFSWGEVPLNATAAIAERTKTPLLALSLDEKPAVGKEYVIRMSNSPGTLLAPLVSALRSRGNRRFGVIKIDDPFIDSCVEGFKKNLQPGETLDLIASLLPGDTDLKTAVLKARTGSYDAIGVYLYPGQVSSFYRQLFASNGTQATFGTDLFESRTEIQNAGPAIEGALYPNFEMPGWFAEEYIRAFGNDSQITYAFNAYAFALITARALGETVVTPRGIELIRKFSTVSDVPGVAFTYRETKEGRFFEFPIVVKRVSNGSFSTAPSRQGLEATPTLELNR